MTEYGPKGQGSITMDDTAGESVCGAYGGDDSDECVFGGRGWGGAGVQTGQLRSFGYPGRIASG